MIDPQLLLLYHSPQGLLSGEVGSVASQCSVTSSVLLWAGKPPFKSGARPMVTFGFQALVLSCRLSRAWEGAQLENMFSL